MPPLVIPCLLVAVFVIGSGFFAMSESVMSSVSRYRMRKLAEQKVLSARTVLDLLEQTDKLSGTLLLGRILLDAATVTACAFIVLELFGMNHWAFIIGSAAIALILFCFAEIMPRRIGAAHADRLAPKIGSILALLTRLCCPILISIDWVIRIALRVLLLEPALEKNKSRFTAESLRTLILEAGGNIPQIGHGIVLNLFNLEQITVEDIMTPRAAMEAIDIGLQDRDIVSQLSTAYHSRLPVYEHEPSQILGIAHLQRLFALVEHGKLNRQTLKEHLSEPYFIPAATPVLAQLQYFQDNKTPFALVVDEYGEILGLVTLADIIGEIVGESATSIPGKDLQWDDGCVLIEGSRPLREINRKLNLEFPLDGPKTLNGLILEHFRDIPVPGISIKIGGIPIEIVQTQGKSVKTARLFKPIP